MTNRMHGGFDLQFTFTPTTSSSVLVKTDSVIKAFNDQASEGPAGIEVGLEEIGGLPFVWVKLYRNTTLIEKSNFPLGASAMDHFQVRMCFMDLYLAVSVNGCWVYFYGFTSVTHNNPTAVKLKAIGDGVTITNILSVELRDLRMAVFVDYEATADNALSSVIQERPVEMFAEVGRALSFTYRVIRDELNGNWIREFEQNVSDPGDAASDALIYYEDVSISISERTAKELGLVTRMYRLSNLETGANEASTKIQLNAIERKNMVSLTTRIDPRLQRNDLLILDFYATGTGRHITEAFIVEDINISLMDGKGSMSVSGRRFSDS